MNKPVLSIDVAKLNSHAAAFLSYDKPFKKPFKFNHTPDELKGLLGWLDDLEKITGFKPQIVLEATGNYSKPVKQFFLDYNYEVIELNPLQTHQIKRKTVRKIKTDPIDTHRIAQAYYLNGGKPQYDPPIEIAELRSLCRQYDGLTEVYTGSQQRFRSIIDLAFPQYETVFSDLTSISSLHLLATFPTPKTILSATDNDLREILKLGKQGQAWMNEKIVKLRIAAKESLSFTKTQQTNSKLLRDYVKIIFTQQEVLNGLKDQIATWAELNPAYPLILSIPGVGMLTAATAIGEIGDIHRFPSTKQLIAFAGLDPSVYESGNFRSTNNKISKRGSTYLRKYLFLAARVGTRKDKGKPVNPVLYHYYHKKLDEGKHKKVARIATASKLLRTIYGIWKNEQPFKC